MKYFFGEPSPPPPPTVSAVEPDIRGATTIREQLAKHREHASCDRCHRKIDPLGFALESFDVIGGWRDHYRSLGEGAGVKRVVDFRPVNYKQGLPVDPSGALADGRAFSGIKEFREQILEDERQIARNLAERLIVFSTGAGISFADRSEVESILDHTQESGYGARDLVFEIIQSRLFQSK